MGKALQRHLASRNQPLHRLSSRLLPVGASELTNAWLANSFGFSPTQPLGFMVFETTLGEKTVYCCLAGGHLDREGAVWFTQAGQAAFEALLRLPTTMDPVILRSSSVGESPSTARSGRPWKRRCRVPASVFLVIWPANWMGWPLKP